MGFTTERDRPKALAAVLAAATLALGFWAYLVVRMGESDLVPLDDRVCDHAQLIDADSAEKIDRVCRGVKERTDIDLLVATIPKSRPYAPDAYAARLVERFMADHPGSKGAILLLVSKAEGYINIEVSPQIGLVLPKSTGEKILDDHVLPQFKRANEEAGKANDGKRAASVTELIGKGLREGVNAIAQRLSDMMKIKVVVDTIERTSRKPAVPEEELRRRRIYLFSAVAATILLILWALYRLFVTRCPKCGFRVRPQSSVIELPTRGKPGLTVRQLACRRCGFTDGERVVTYYRRFVLGTILSALGQAAKAWSRRRRRDRRKRSV